MTATQQGNLMRYCALILAVVAAATAARAQDAIPDLKGTWSGKGKVIIFGGHTHHPGVSLDSPPTVRDIEMTLLVEGQDGRLAWGRSSSANADTKEPFAWAMSSDNKSIIGSDTDGSFRITLLAPDRMEKCYTHNGLSPSKSIVAGCYQMERVRK
jgi:hypothetical protein